MDLTLKSVTFLTRHGARGPGKSEMQPFVDYESGQKLPIAMQWCDHEMEVLTAVGVHQIQQLGQFIYSHLDSLSRTSSLVLPTAAIDGPVTVTALYDEYFEELKTLSAQNPVLWRSSPIERTTKSGRDFLTGFRAALLEVTDEGARLCSDDCFPDSPYEAPGPDEMAGSVALFRSWNVVELYRDYVKKIKTGPDFRQKAELEGCFLRDVMDRLGNAGALASQDSDSQDILTMLYHMTYVHGMVEVELYWPANQDTPTPTVTLGAGDKSLLTDALTNEHREHVEGLARWVWNKRFQAGDQGHLIGLAILKELVSLATGACDGVAPSTPLALFSGHDYSILAFLTGLGVTSEYTAVLGYGSFVTIETYTPTPCLSQASSERNSDCSVVRFLINQTPFKQEVGGACVNNMQGGMGIPLPDTAEACPAAAKYGPGFVTLPWLKDRVAYLQRRCA